MVGWLVASALGLAAERPWMHLSESDGLRSAHAEQLCQDASGFLWVGSFSGLQRFDGTTFVDWAPETLSGGATAFCATTGQYAIHHPRRRVFDLTKPGRPEPVHDADGRILEGVRSLAGGPSGELWWIRAGAVEAWLDERFVRFPPESLGGAASWIAIDGGAALAGVANTLQRLTPGAPPQLLATFDSPVYQIRQANDGAIWVSTIGTLNQNAWSTLPHLFRLDDSQVPQPIERIDRLVRGMDAADNGQMLVCDGQALRLVRPNGDSVTLKRMEADGADLCTDALVDVDGGFWQSAFDGIHYLAEPEVERFSVSDGLPLHPRFAALDASGLVASTWYGLGRIDEVGERFTSSDLGVGSALEICADGAGTVWAFAYAGVSTPPGRGMVVVEGAKTRLVRALDQYQGRCHVTADGSMLLTGDGRLWRGTAGGAEVVELGALPTALGVAPAVATSQEGKRWIAAGSTLCSGAPSAWQCDRLPFGAAVVALEVLRGSTLIVATAGDGIWARTPTGQWFNSLSARPGCRTAESLSRSPRGGLWVGMAGCALRIDVDDDEKLLVLEELGTRQGGLRGGAGSISESPNGDLWLATLSGVLRIPQAVRDRPTSPPPVILQSAMTAAGQPLNPGASLPYAGAGLELTLAVPFYRARDQLRYRLRLGPRDGWASLDGPRVRLFGLRPGPYAVDVQVSLDGVAWRGLNQPVRFRVLAPWYRRPGALAGWVALGLLIGMGIHRFRVRHLRRLLDQRQAIARDLHDELGSGLGSIGLIASGIPGPSAQTIGAMAEELGFALADVVAALRPGALSVPSLIRYLVDRGDALFAESSTQFRTVLDRPLPAVPLSAMARRELQRIAIEALYNAARHASATTVTLEFQVHRRHSILAVVDDGVGFDLTALDPDEGIGLQSLAQRARRIGAILELDTAPGAGTRLAVCIPMRRRKTDLNP